MKILKLTILDQNSKEIRKIDFYKNDISFVYGNVLKPRSKLETINSIGKTLTLKMIDYVFGCNTDNNLCKKGFGKYKILATVFYNEREFFVERSLDGEIINVDGESKKISEYRDMFSIDRNELSKQIILYNKGSLIGFNKNPDKNDYYTYISMLGLEDLSNEIKSYYLIREEINNLEKTKENLLEILKIDAKAIEEEIYINEKNIEELKTKMKQLNKDVDKIQVSKEECELQNEYELISEKIKKNQSAISMLSIELRNLNEYILEVNNNQSLSINEIKKIYEKAYYEVPQMVIKKIEEVECFFCEVIQNRVDTIMKRIKVIESSIEEKEKEKSKLISKMDNIGKILATNEAYKKSIKVLNEYNTIFSEEKFKQGKLFQAKKIIDQLSVASKKQREQYNKIKAKIDESKERLKIYKDYVYDIVKSIYNDSVYAYFNISNGAFRKNSKAVEIDLKIQGEGGEGVTEVKKNIIDILLFKYCSKYSILVLDSSCFNGIDTRQIQGLINCIADICTTLNKQAIIAINKYQLTEEIEKKVLKNKVIELSENDKLFKIDF